MHSKDKLVNDKIVHYFREDFSWTSAKQEATKEFIEVVNNIRRQRRAGPLSWNTAVKFLMARKFDVGRAVALYEQHEATRIREGLAHFDPTKDPLKSELDTGKFTILPSRDATGAAIAVFTARLHYPHRTAHRTTLQGVVYQLDVALESVDTQRCGLIFIYDMTESKYSNFDYELSQKILTLLKGAYPARLKKVLIVTAPLWFKAPFKILRLFVREKLRERVYTVSLPQLPLHIPVTSLPNVLGGELPVEHSAWLLQCLKSLTNRNGSDLCDILPQHLDQSHTMALATGVGGLESATNGDLSKSGFMGNNPSDIEESSSEKKKIRAGHSLDLTPEDEEIEDNLCNGAHASPNNEEHGKRSGGSGAPSPSLPLSSASSGFSDDDSLHLADSGGMSIEEFVTHVKTKGKQGLCRDYFEIKGRPAEGTFNMSRLKNNLLKNRYTDVLCYDHSRVLLSQIEGDPTSDYINANFVDGYKQKNAFISTQGPLPKTSADFWRMVWEQQVLIVVMTTRAMERGRTKCAQYWPERVDCGTLVFDNFEVTNMGTEQTADYVISALELTNSKTSEQRKVIHMQFTSWPDYGVPDSALAMLEFLHKIREQQVQMVSELGDTWAGHPLGPPIVVHCSAGIGRTGTLCTLDICIRRLEDVGTVDVQGTVERIRSQRAHSIQMPDQYVFCHLALIEYALSRGLLTDPDLAGFDEGASDSD